METQQSINSQRIGVIATNVSLLVGLIIFEYGKIYQWTIFILAILCLSIIILIWSFYVSYIKTGLWKFIHKPIKELDEREIALTSESLKYAYAIFSVSVLLLLLFSVLVHFHLDIIVVAGLIFFAHILPASIIAWIVSVIK